MGNRELYSEVRAVDENQKVYCIGCGVELEGFWSCYCEECEGNLYENGE